MNNNKASGPDEFPIQFYKKFWNLLKNDIMKVFSDFHRKDIINKNVTNTYIALIAKKNICKVAKDFRPINLTTSLYKIIVKTLANGLKITLPGTIAESQMAFVKERQITDAILMANEVADFSKSSKTKGFILKLNIEKAFDKVSWKFIDHMLEKKNHPITLRKWINVCISNVLCFILINGKPQGRINLKRGIRQGNPISPFIFILAMNYFSRLLKHLEKRQMIKVISFNSECNLTHILFVDDILLFIEDDNFYINNLQMALELFKKASDLNINLAKSTISPINVSTSKAEAVPAN